MNTRPLLVFVVLLTPVATAAPINLDEECFVIDPQWVNCGGYVAIDRAGGIPIDEARFGLETSPDCGSIELDAAPPDPMSPEVAACTLEAELLAGELAASLPDQEALLVTPGSVHGSPAGGAACLEEAGNYDICIGPPATAISTGPDQSCALLVSKNVFCWGSNGGGQAEPYTGGDAVAVGTGTSYTCVLQESGNVVCYGLDWLGRTQGYSGGDAVAISVGDSGGCAVRSNGNVHCWGATPGHYLGGNAQGVSVGGYHVCVLLTNRNVHCYGENNNGERIDYNGGNAIGVGAGYDHTCILLTTGNVRCYGENSWGQANGYNGGDAVQLSTNIRSSCVLRSNGTTYCWGRFTESYAEGDALAVSVGWAHACVLYGIAGTGYVDCEGANPSGESDDYIGAQMGTQIGPPTAGVRSDETIHVGGVIAFRAGAAVRTDSSTVDDIKAEGVDRYAAAIAAVTGGDLRPLLLEVLRLQSEPPPVFTILYGPDGVTQLKADTDPNETPGCYGVDDHSGFLREPMRFCSPFLP